MKLKSRDIPKLKKSIISVFEFDSPPSDELRRAFLFQIDMLYVCNEALKTINAQNRILTYSTIMYFALLTIVGLNLFCVATNPIDDNLTTLMLLHSLISLWFGFIYYAVVEQAQHIKNNTTSLVNEFFQQNFFNINKCEPNLKELLRNVNKTESNKGFEANWKFLVKHGK